MAFGLVTAAGLGTRSGLDGRMRKELLPVYDLSDGNMVLRPVLDVVIRKLESAGCTKVIVVVDPSDNLTIGYLEKNFPECKLAYQDEKLGYGDAVYRGVKLCSNQDVFLNAGDGFVAMDAYYENIVKAGESVLTLFEVEDPSSYGNAALSQDGKRVISVSEKPAVPMSNLAMAATYYFKKDLLHYISPDNREITESIQNMVASECVVPRIIPKDSWLSIGRKEDYYKILKRSYDIIKK